MWAGLVSGDIAKDVSKEIPSKAAYARIRQAHYHHSYSEAISGGLASERVHFQENERIWTQK